MKVFFLFPNSPGRYAKALTPPVGIAYLATFLRSRGHDVRCLDMRVAGKKADYLKMLKNFDPDFVAVSFMSNYYKYSYALIDEIKTKTKFKVIVGGAHPTIMKAKVLEECRADFLVYGEGEHALLEVIDGKPCNEIKNLVWRDNNTIVVNPAREVIGDLDALPFPDYELFNLNAYLRKRIPLTTARGCPHRCIYCAVDLIGGKRFRPRSAKNVVDEIEYWFKKGYRDFGFNDDTFTENMPRAGEICDEIIRRNIKISWDLRTGLRVDRVNKELLKKLKASGCKFIAFGIESIDPVVLKYMNKDITPRQAEDAVKQTKEAGIGVGGFFMIGTPHDTYERFKKTYAFADQKVFDEARFYNTEPYPGTPLFFWIQQNGHFLSSPQQYLNERSRWDQEPIFETNEFPARLRCRAFNEGEYLVTKKLVTKVLSHRLGFLIYGPCQIKLIRQFVLAVGFSMAGLALKLLELKNEER